MQIVSDGELFRMITILCRDSNVTAAVVVVVVQADSSARDSTATAHVHVYTGSTCRYGPASQPPTDPPPACTLSRHDRHPCR